MIDMMILTGLLSVGLLFVLIATQAYTRSISTAIYVVSLAISMQAYSTGKSDIAFGVIILGAVICLVRAIFNHNTDQIFKRG